MDDDERTSISVDTIRRLALPSTPPSPHSSASPSSPSGDSVSSFPSVSSSFLFSSAAASPPHPASRPDHDPLLAQGLIIPSLTLPSPLRRPTPYGQTLGDLRLLVLSRTGVDTRPTLSILADEDFEDIVEVGQWEDLDLPNDAASEQSSSRRARRLRCSTDWIEHRDPHGLEKFEPARNVEIVDLPQYDLDTELEDFLRHILPFIHVPFHSVLSAFDANQPPTELIAGLISAPSTPLYTALLFLLAAAPSPLERKLIAELSTHIPLILLPSHPDAQHRPSSTHSRQSPYRSSTHLPQSTPPLPQARTYHRHTHTPSHTYHLASFRPPNVHALRIGLFRTPETLAALRSDAADRFLRWREVERAVNRVLSQGGESHSRRPTLPAPAAEGRRSHGRWDKARWEAEWEGALSTDVARTLRQRREQVRDLGSPAPALKSSEDDCDDCPRERHTDKPPPANPHPIQCFDPLHLPSLFVFSLSLFAPLRTRIARAVGPRIYPRLHSGATSKRGRSLSWGLGLALVGAFCAGLGLGFVVARM